MVKIFDLCVGVSFSPKGELKILKMRHGGGQTVSDSAAEIKQPEREIEFFLHPCPLIRMGEEFLIAWLAEKLVDAVVDFCEPSQSIANCFCSCGSGAIPDLAQFFFDSDCGRVGSEWQAYGSKVEGLIHHV